MTQIIQENNTKSTSATVVPITDIDNRELIDGKYIDLDVLYQESIEFTAPIYNKFYFYLEPLVTFDGQYPSFVDGLFNIYLAPTKDDHDWDASQTERIQIYNKEEGLLEDNSVFTITDFDYPNIQTNTHDLEIGCEKLPLVDEANPEYVEFSFFINSWTKYDRDSQVTVFGEEGEEGFKRGLALPQNSTKVNEETLEFSVNMKVLSELIQFDIKQSFGNTKVLTGEDGRFDFTEV